MTPHVIPPDVTPPDVVVLGGGPAGCATALRLARLGHRVTLVERGGARKPHEGESLAPSVALALRALDGDADANPAGPDAAAAGTGHRVTDRAAFDAALRAQARAADVRVVTDHADEPQPWDADGSAGWRVPLRHGADLHARAVVDARGRRARLPATGARTMALAVHLQGPGADGAGAAAEVATFEDGWVWLAPLAPGRQVAVLFLDASAAAGLPAAARERGALARLAACPALAQRLRGTRCLGVHASDATPRAAADPAPSPRWLRVGDAAFTLDPLSAQGVAAALRSGLQAAACLHTALRRPAQQGLAQAFHRQACARVVAAHAATAQAFHAEGLARWGTDFWRQRSGGLRATEEPPGAWPEPGARVRCHPQLQAVQAPALVGDFIEARPALIAPGWDGPVAWLAGQPLQAWLPEALARPEGLPLGALVQAWRERHGTERTAAAWPWLWQRRAVVPVVPVTPEVASAAAGHEA